jgi:hypothetical protein
MLALGLVMFFFVVKCSLGFLSVTDCVVW